MRTLHKASEEVPSCKQGTVPEVLELASYFVPHERTSKPLPLASPDQSTEQSDIPR